jgi:nucleotide-binding universal stress UspA family protein
MSASLMKRILIATDFSVCARRALEYGVCFARAWSASLDLLHVVEVLPGLEADASAADPLMEPRRKESGRILSNLATLVRRDGMEVVWRVRQGIPSEQIVQAAREQRADLIVVGTHGRTGLDHILLGSTAERVIRRALCPVLTVRVARGHVAEQDEETPPRIRHILVPVDFSSPSLDALEYAIQVVDGFGARLTLLHVLEPIYYDLELGLGRIEQEVQKRTHWEACRRTGSATLPYCRRVRPCRAHGPEPEVQPRPPACAAADDGVVRRRGRWSRVTFTSPNLTWLV